MWGLYHPTVLGSAGDPQEGAWKSWWGQGALGISTPPVANMAMNVCGLTMESGFKNKWFRKRCKGTLHYTTIEYTLLTTQYIVGLPQLCRSDHDQSKFVVNEHAVIDAHHTHTHSTCVLSLYLCSGTKYQLIRASTFMSILSHPPIMIQDTSLLCINETPGH